MLPKRKLRQHWTLSVLICAKTGICTRVLQKTSCVLREIKVIKTKGGSKFLGWTSPLNKNKSELGWRFFSLDRITGKEERIKNILQT